MGLLETVYEIILAQGLRERGFQVERQVAIPIEYQGCRFDECFRADLIVENKVIVELKRVEKLNNAHKKQLLTYLRLTFFACLAALREPIISQNYPQTGRSNMKFLTRAMVAVIERMMQSEHVREAVWRTARDLFAQRPFAPSDLFAQPPLPERFFSQSADERADQKEESPIFITARFRSGSTFLWNLFRALPGVTAYYEPLNENRWFLQKGPGGQVDATHLGVSDYRREYQGIAGLDGLFRDSWAFRQFYMDQMHYDPALYRYLFSLIEHAAGRPVLQFNRVDFRLPWLKANFPRARIVHLYRDPRETWMSILCKSQANVPLKGEWRPGHYKDLFYTYEWASDLKRVFPFLDPTVTRHPYEVHYHLWRLSYSFGAHYADYSLGYEELVEDFAVQLPRMLDHVGIGDVDMERLQRMNKGRVRNRWQDYAEAEWFEEIERNCEREQQAFFYLREESAIGPEEHLLGNCAMGDSRRRI